MPKAEYDLMPNESVIIRRENVAHNNKDGELVLTNLNLVHIISKGVFKTTYIPQRFPIKQIKIFNGKAQALLSKDATLDVYFMHGQESFRFFNTDTLFSNKKAEKEALSWANAINQLVTKEDIVLNKSATTASMGAEVVAGVVGDTVGAFRDALGFKAKNSSPNVTNKVAKKCTSCGATISGSSGHIVQCSYCDADQQL